MCGPWVSDGENQDTIDIDDPNPVEGHHEPQEYYKDCRARQRNLGLFLFNKNLGVNNAAIRTRQQSNNRYGTECPEEKSYYPYWHPTPWRDIAILTSHTSRCKYYSKNSQNVVPKHHCVRTGSVLDFKPSVSGSLRNVFGRYPTENLLPGDLVPNNKADCEEKGHTWEEVPSWGLPAPDCVPTFYARDNHLGNSYIFGKLMTNVYKWKVADVVVDDPGSDKDFQYGSCVLRFRYNISTEDWAPWGEVDGKGMVDASYNEQSRKTYGNNREDPTVTYGYNDDGTEKNLTINVDYEEFGRTFEDRSHVMFIRRRPSNIAPSAQIYNLNVRGRRGNIVQAYPAVEHDFVPLHLKCNKEDYIHIQWTGNDEGPANQNGGGRDKYERHNIVLIKDNNGRKNWPEDIKIQKLFSQGVANQLAYLDQPGYCETIESTGCCLTVEQLYIKHEGNQNEIAQDLQNCFYLNAAPQYFSVVTKAQSTGTFYFMSTRNNDFTNRSHKGIIEVSLKLHPIAIAGVAIGSAAFVGAAIVAFGAWYAKSSPDSAPDFFHKLKI